MSRKIEVKVVCPNKINSGRLKPLQIVANALCQVRENGFYKMEFDAGAKVPFVFYDDPASTAKKILHCAGVDQPANEICFKIKNAMLMGMSSNCTPFYQVYYCSTRLLNHRLQGYFVVRENSDCRVWWSVRYTAQKIEFELV